MKLASLFSCGQRSQPSESIKAALLVLIAMCVIGCSPENRTADQSGGIGTGSDLTDPPIAPPYLTDLQQGEDQGVAMRFGETDA